MKYSIRVTDEYIKWYEKEQPKVKAQIEKRLKNITDHGHFGDDKDLDEGLSELKWKNGRRIYFSVFEDAAGNIVVLLLGGNKNGQSKDISQARKILGSIYEASEDEP